MTLSVCESAILCEILTELRCITPIDSTGGSGDYMSGIDGPDLRSELALCDLAR